MMKDRVEQQFGNYRLVRYLGQGGFAQVYLGEHIYLQTQAAIKVLHLRLAHSELKDFLQEARTIAHLSHPHIVQVFDFGLEGSIPYLVMQYAPHGSLRQRHPTGSLVPLPTIVTYVQTLASALQYAHSQNIVHRDVKPENMLLGKGQELLLSDFGVAVVARGRGRTGNTPQQESGGTLAYMAPEQINGFASPASDQYALGIVVYEWLCGSRPFSGSLEDIILQHLHTNPPTLREHLPTIVPALEQVVFKALAKDPQQRFASVSDFAMALVQASQLQPTEHVTLSSSISPTGDQRVLEQTPSHSEHASTSSPITPIWNIPYRRNPFFTGRESILQTLHSRFHEENAATSPYWIQPQAICGLGGIGKTQTAIEYAYRYSAGYQAILWARADSYETLCADFVMLAYWLHLHNSDEQNQPNQQDLIATVKHWLAGHTHWLLILDNVEDLSIVNAFLPSLCRGHVILTTRIQATGQIANGIDLEKLELADAALFLLRRTGIIQQHELPEDTVSADSIEAKDIAQVMDGLPLALDQAGAYIEGTGCSLFDYFDRYRKQRTKLLDLRGDANAEHPEPVTTTWRLSFAKVEQINPAAAELLRFCTFLHPDDIPEAFIANGASLLGPQLEPMATDPAQLDAAIATLRKFSLVRRNAQQKMLTIHRLVQAVLKDDMDTETQCLWADRVIQVINRSFPRGDQVASWPACQRYLPHVYLCLPLIEQWHLASPEAAHLLDQAGLYLLEQAQYTQARYLLRTALTMREEMQGTDHLDVAETMNYLAGTYLYQGMYTQAEVLFQQVLAIRERLQGPSHPDVAIELNNLALLYNKQGKYALAEPLFLRALTIWEQAQSMEHPDVARTLNNLALLYQDQHKFSQAEALYLRGLTIWEGLSDPAHPDLAVSLNNLAKLYSRLGKYTQAESLFQRVLEIREKTLGADHPAVAHSLDFLAQMYQSEWKYALAELFFKHSLNIRRRALGMEHPDVAHSLKHLAHLYSSLGAYEKAEPLFRQAIAIFEQTLGPDHPDLADVLKHYAVLLSAMKRKNEAIRLVARVMAIRHA
jgi:serine/threonine protein kinase/tetratricopeptide (TPR) repeat protein